MGHIAKVIGKVILAAVFMLSTFCYYTTPTYAASDFDIITVDLHVGGTISIVCTGTVTMGAITGTGQSNLATNSATCTIITGNATGYNLNWQASSATMASGGDTIAAYTPAVANTPETWSVAGADSEWGAHLGASSTTVDTGVWGLADTYAGGKWLNVNNAASFEIANRGSNTDPSGDTEYIFFGGEVGASHFQPTGTYTVDVTMTATTN